MPSRSEAKTTTIEEHLEEIEKLKKMVEPKLPVFKNGRCRVAAGDQKYSPIQYNTFTVPEVSFEFDLDEDQSKWATQVREAQKFVDAHQRTIWRDVYRTYRSRIAEMKNGGGR